MEAAHSAGLGAAPSPPLGPEAVVPAAPTDHGLIVAVLFVIGLAVSGDDTATVSGPPTEEPATTEEPPTDRGAGHHRGDEPVRPGGGPGGEETLSFEDSFGDHSADITVVRKKVSTGDEFNKPTHGRFVGLFVKVKAFQDGITVPEFYVNEKGRHYDATCCTQGFEPD